MMRKILEATDRHRELLPEDLQEKNDLPAPFSIAKSAVHIAEESEAKAIIVEVTDETLVKTISHFRPKTAIIAITKDSTIAKRLVLTWGIIPVIVKNKKSMDGAKKILIDTGILNVGDTIVCVHNGTAKKSANANTITTEII